MDLTDLTAAGVLAAVLAALVTGRLVPGPSHDDVKAQRDASMKREEAQDEVLRQLTSHVKSLADQVVELARGR